MTSTPRPITKDLAFPVREVTGRIVDVQDRTIMDVRSPPVYSLAAEVRIASWTAEAMNEKWEREGK